MAQNSKIGGLLELLAKQEEVLGGLADERGGVPVPQDPALFFRAGLYPMMNADVRDMRDMPLGSNKEYYSLMNNLDRYGIPFLMMGKKHNNPYSDFNEYVARKGWK